MLSRSFQKFGAEEGTRTPTPLRVRGPEPRASANSATSARYTKFSSVSAEPAASLSLANRVSCVNPNSRTLPNWGTLRGAPPPCSPAESKFAPKATRPRRSLSMRAPWAGGLISRLRAFGQSPRVRPASRPARSPCCSRTASRWGSRPWHPRQPCRRLPCWRPEQWRWW